MGKRPFTDADRVAAGNLRRLWDEKKKQLGLTQDKAADLLGFTTQGAVSHYLTGRNPLNTDATLKFAALLNVAPTEIRPDMADLLSTSVENKSMQGLSEATRNFIAWVIDRASSGNLTDAGILRLWGRAEEIAEHGADAAAPTATTSGTNFHDWIAGGRTPLPHGAKWKMGRKKNV